jgi:DNA-binding IclR family transcriptional regulator
VGKISRPVLEQLWRATGETVNLAVMEGHEALYIDVLESAHTFRLVSKVGARRPLYCTALGKAMLAFLSEEEQQYLIAGESFERFTPNTLCRPTQLKKDLSLTRERGYSIDNEEVYLGSRCIAAPVFDQSGKVAAAVSVSGPTMRVPKERVPVFANATRQAASAISKRLGYAAN